DVPRRVERPQRLGADDDSVRNHHRDGCNGRLRSRTPLELELMPNAFLWLVAQRAQAAAQLGTQPQLGPIDNPSDTSPRAQGVVMQFGAGRVNKLTAMGVDPMAAVQIVDGLYAPHFKAIVDAGRQVGDAPESNPGDTLSRPAISQPEPWSAVQQRQQYED